MATTHGAQCLIRGSMETRPDPLGRSGFGVGVPPSEYADSDESDVFELGRRVAGQFGSDDPYDFPHLIWTAADLRDLWEVQIFNGMTQWR